MFQAINAQLELEQCCIIRINLSLTLKKYIAAVMHATVHAVHPYPRRVNSLKVATAFLVNV